MKKRIIQLRRKDDEASISATTWKGRFENDYGHKGCAYVDLENRLIRMAYSASEFCEKTKALMEVLKKYGL